MTRPAYKLRGYLICSSGHCTKTASARCVLYRIVPDKDSLLTLAMLSTYTIWELYPNHLQETDFSSMLVKSWLGMYMQNLYLKAEAAMHTGMHVPGPFTSTCRNWCQKYLKHDYHILDMLIL